MTLTEEQRAAIHAVSGLLTAIGCPQCHSYLQKNYTHHIEVLRAMTDSSEHFSDATKMIGFDMEKARASIAHYRIENPSNVDTESALKELVDQANLAEDALAEIERLRADNAGLSKAVVDIGQERDLAQAEFRAYHQAWEEQAARIKELGGALAEYQRHGKIISEAVVPCLTVHGNCDQCRPKTKAACEAIGAIRKGKIGPDADAKPQVWQITEERVGLLEYCLESLLDAPDIDDYSEPRQSIRMLRAMLKEAL